MSSAAVILLLRFLQNEGWLKSKHTNIAGDQNGLSNALIGLQAQSAQMEPWLSSVLS